MDRGGLTKAGRGLQKHGGRSGSVFSKPTGNLDKINRSGQNVLDDILTQPSCRVTFDDAKRFGRIFDLEVPNKGGVRFTQDGKFIGFLEP